MKRTFFALAVAGACWIGCRGPGSGSEDASAKAELLRVDDRALSTVPASSPSRPEFETGSISLPDGTVLAVEVARSPEAREYGLMFRESLPDRYGMLFEFPEQRFLTFWMKNTFVDLDMIFLDGDGRVTVIHARVPKSARGAPDREIARRSGVGRFVLELPGGAAERYGLAPGQRLRFEAR